MSTEAKSWRCFHCDEVFTDPEAAREHFGDLGLSVGVVVWDEPACKIDPREYRRMKRELERYQAEDADLHRQIEHLKSEHQQALMRAEEAGYDRGLRDGSKLWYP